MKRRLWAALAAIPLLAVAACGGSSDDTSENSADEFKVVFVSGLSGPLEPVASGLLAALKGSADAINDEGGIEGRTVTVEGIDGQGDPTKSVNALQKRLRSGDKPDLVFAGVASAEVLAMLPLLAREGLMSTAGGAAGPIDDKEAYPNHRNITPNIQSQLVALKTYVEDNDIKKLAIVAGQDAQGDGAVAGVTATLEGTGVELVEERFSTTDLDVSGTWDKVKAANVDAAFAECLGDPCSRLLEGRVKAGATDIPTVGGSGVGGTAGGPSAYASAEATENLSIVVFNVQVAGFDSPTFETFQANYEKYESEYGSLIGAALAWDGLRLFAQAAKQAGSTDQDAMLKEIDAGLDLPSGYLLMADTLPFPEGKTMPVPSADSYSIIPASSPVVNGQFAPPGS